VTFSKILIGFIATTLVMSCAKKKEDDKTAPTAPTELTLESNIAPNLLSTPKLTWTAATDDTGVVEYQSSIYKTSDNSEVKGWTKLSSGERLTGLSGTETLSSGILYYIKVRAIDAAGNIGPEASSDNWSTCPANYVNVPSNSGVGTINSFCISKYEMKISGSTDDTNGGQTYDSSWLPESRVSGTPWINLTLNNAKDECQSLGSNYDLINTQEWITTSADIASTASNWSGGTIGSGMVNRGHSDTAPFNTLASSTDEDPYYGTGNNVNEAVSSGWEQKRTHNLSNSELIWDFAGNVAEWVDDINTNDKIAPTSGYVSVAQSSGTTGMPLISLRPTSAVISWWNDSWDSTQGFGSYYPGQNGQGGYFQRGGAYLGGSATGLLSLVLTNSANSKSTLGGFRCVYRYPVAATTYATLTTVSNPTSTQNTTVNLASVTSCTHDVNSGLVTVFIGTPTSPFFSLKIKGYSLTNALTYTCTQTTDNQTTKSSVGSMYDSCGVHLGLYGNGTGGSLSQYSTFRDSVDVNLFTYSGTCTVNITEPSPVIRGTINCGQMIQSYFSGYPINPIDNSNYVNLSGNFHCTLQ
jgi:hypothetical protein